MKFTVSLETVFIIEAVFIIFRSKIIKCHFLPDRLQNDS